MLLRKINFGIVHLLNMFRHSIRFNPVTLFTSFSVIALTFNVPAVLVPVTVLLSYVGYVTVVSIAYVAVYLFVNTCVNVWYGLNPVFLYLFSSLA